MKYPVFLRRSAREALSEKPPKVPVTKEYMALKVASGKLLTEAEICFPDALAESVIPMAYHMSHRYKVTCRDDVDDLASDCVARLFDKLHKFDATKGTKFNTWAWYVFMSILKKRYFQTKRYRDIFFDLEDVGVDAAIGKDNCVILQHEMAVVVQELMVAHPKYRRLLEAIFGKVESEDHIFPSRICVSKAAEKIGMDRTKALAFHNGIVKPYFMKKFDLANVREQK